MEIRKVVAIIRSSALPDVVKSLKALKVEGVTVFPVKGYGEHANFYKSDWMVDNAKVELFTKLSRVDAIVNAILESAHAGIAGDGMVAVLPVEKLYRIRTRTEATADEL